MFLLETATQLHFFTSDDVRNLNVIFTSHMLNVFTRDGNKS